VISLHCPLTADSATLVSRERLLRDEATAYIVNTSRGPLIDQDALIAALKGGTIAGAGIDVYDIEPLPLGNPPDRRAQLHRHTAHRLVCDRGAQAPDADRGRQPRGFPARRGEHGEPAG
jgi:lactate dehydrogenase-like 2-hydroxyacid dehydrogenase